LVGGLKVHQISPDRSVPAPSISPYEDCPTTSLKNGLPAEIAARRKQYEYYRDQLLTFTPLE